MAAYTGLANVMLNVISASVFSAFGFEWFRIF